MRSGITAARASMQETYSSFTEQEKKYIVRKVFRVDEKSKARGMTLLEAQQEVVDRAEAEPGSVFVIFKAVGMGCENRPMFKFLSIDE